MKRLLLIAVALCLVPNVFAASIEDIQKAWDSKLPNMAGAKITASPIPGLYMVMTPPQVFYIDAEVKYLVEGSIVNMDSKVNETTPFRRMATLMSVQALEPTMIKFSPEGKPKHVVTVFTDVDCFYCQKLHQEIAQYNKMGIEIRYLAWPRAGAGSPSYKKIESVWCADDKKKALTNAKSGKNIQSKTCDSPVKQHLALGEMLGVRGTPAMVLETGELFPGYVPAKVLGPELDKLKNKAQKVSMPVN